MEIGLVPFIIILSDPFVQFLLREIDPDYSEELELLLHNEGSRAKGTMSKTQGFSGSPLGENSMPSNYKWEL